MRMFLYPALIGLATAFPDAGFLQKRATSTPSTTSTSTVPVGTYATPGLNDVRGPCPAWNILANEGYFNRSGRYLTQDVIVAQFFDKFSMDPAAIAPLLYLAFQLNTTSPLGLRTPNEVNGTGVMYINIDDLRQHNHIEHDGSLMRYDYDQGDNYSPQLPLVQQLISFSSDGKYITPLDAARFRIKRVNDQRSANKAFSLDAVHDTFGWIETSLYINVLKDSTGNVPVSFLKEFWYDQKFPTGWTKSPTTITGDQISTLASYLGTIANTITGGLYIPSHDPAPFYRAVENQVNYNGNLHITAVPGLPPTPGGTSGALVAEGEYAQLLGMELPWSIKIGANLTATLAWFTSSKVAAFTSLTSVERTYGILGAPPSLGPQSLTDEFFGRARTTFSPFYLTKATASLPFSLTDSQVSGLMDSGVTLASALSSGKLFVVDHSMASQFSSNTNTGRYGCAPVALFYLNAPGKIMPLAIKLDSGAGLVVTPLNGYDWSLAKMIFNSVEFFHANLIDNAFLTSIALTPITTSKLRFLNAAHPVYAVLDAVLKVNVGSVLAGSRLGLVDVTGLANQIGTYNSQAIVGGILQLAQRWTFFQSNPIQDAINRGVANITDHPFNKFAAAHYLSAQNMMYKLVKVYYPTDADVVADTELQAFAADVATNGGVKGFPVSFSTIQSLSNALAHLQYLTTVMRHATTSSTTGWTATLPASPTAIFAPIPTTLGTVNATNILNWLPNPTQAAIQAASIKSFLRPLAGASDSLYWIYNNTRLNNPSTASILSSYRTDLDAISSAVQAFAASDAVMKGWSTLDPQKLPNFVFV
ncbi:hypothetical protein HDU76_011981 [Blyttiomyces sp. JEL0837]|nr:hypothetical protein HDU76_011981 [Blyttiomyces sp. JEL0837]